MKKLTLGVLLVLFFAVAGFPQTDFEYDKNLINFLADENLGIRSSAAQLLGERKVIAAVEPLMEMVKSDPDSRVKVIASLALYSIGDSRAVPVLKAYANKEKNKTFAHIVATLASKMEKNELAQK